MMDMRIWLMGLMLRGDGWVNANENWDEWGYLMIGLECCWWDLTWCLIGDHAGRWRVMWCCWEMVQTQCEQEGLQWPMMHDGGLLHKTDAAPAIGGGDAGCDPENVQAVWWSLLLMWMWWLGGHEDLVMMWATDAPVWMNNNLNLLGEQWGHCLMTLMMCETWWDGNEMKQWCCDDDNSAVGSWNGDATDLQLQMRGMWWLMCCWTPACMTEWECAIGR